LQTIESLLIETSRNNARIGDNENATAKELLCESSKLIDDTWTGYKSWTLKEIKTEHR